MPQVSLYLFDALVRKGGVKNHDFTYLHAGIGSDAFLVPGADDEIVPGRGIDRADVDDFKFQVSIGPLALANV